MIQVRYLFEIDLEKFPEQILLDYKNKVVCIWELNFSIIGEPGIQCQQLLPHFWKGIES